MPRAIRIHQNGGPEVMRFEEVDLAPPGPGEVRLRHTAIGINFSDVNVRRGGFYFGRPQQFPLALGNEAAGVIEALGEGVQRLRGRRARRLCGHARGILRGHRRLCGGAQRPGASGC